MPGCPPKNVQFFRVNTLLQIQFDLQERKRAGKQPIIIILWDRTYYKSIFRKRKKTIDFFQLLVEVKGKERNDSKARIGG